MKKSFLFILIPLLFCSCNKDLTRTKGYIGTSKEILITHLGDPNMAIDNAEKGEILVYFFNQRTETVNMRNFSRPVNFDEDGNYIEDKTNWNYVVFLIDDENTVYKTEKIFYNLTPQQLKRKLVQRYS
jgi:hypothetical protein